MASPHRAGSDSNRDDTSLPSDGSTNAGNQERSSGATSADNGVYLCSCPLEPDYQAYGKYDLQLSRRQFPIIGPHGIPTHQSSIEGHQIRLEYVLAVANPGLSSISAPQPTIELALERYSQSYSQLDPGSSAGYTAPSPPFLLILSSRWMEPGQASVEEQRDAEPPSQPGPGASPGGTPGDLAPPTEVDAEENGNPKAPTAEDGQEAQKKD